MTSEVRAQVNRTLQHAVDVATDAMFTCSSAFLVAGVWLRQKSEIFCARAEMENGSEIPSNGGGT